jgi:hypothetical protein
VSTSPAPASTLALLDTNAYLRLAKRVRPLLGVPFGQRQYVLTVLQDVEDEVHRSPRLRFHFPWFDGDGAVAAERLAHRMRLGEARRKGPSTTRH